MGTFFDDLKKKLSDFGEDVASQTKSMTESAKLSAKLAEEEKKQKALFLQLGKAYFERAKLFPTPEDKAPFAAIQASLDEADRLRRGIAKAKGLVYCTACGRTYPEGTRFCPNCGTSLGETAEPQKESYAEPQKESE